MNFIKNISLLILITLCNTISIAQFNGYVSGFVVLNDGVEVHGNLKVLSDALSCSKIKFKNDKGDKIKFKTRDVIFYQRGSKEYVKKPHERPFSIIKGMKGYMKILVKGKINLYEYTYTVQSGGSMGANGVMMGSYSSEKNDFYLENQMGRLIRVKKMSFKKDVSDILRDNMPLAEQILSKQLRYRNLREIVNIYNSQDE